MQLYIQKAQQRDGTPSYQIPLYKHTYTCSTRERKTNRERRRRRAKRKRKRETVMWPAVDQTERREG